MRNIRLFVLMTLVMLLALSSRAEDGDISGHWIGKINIPGLTLGIDVDFSHDQENPEKWIGDLSIPQQNATDLRLTNIVYDGTNISFNLPDVPGKASFSGTFLQDSSISGTFFQAGRESPWELQRQEAVDASAADTLQGFSEWIEQAREQWHVPGVSVIIIKGDNILLAEGFGQRNIEDDLPATADTMFAIGSCSKAFTSYLLATLVQDGQLDLDKPVHTYLPDFSLKDPSATQLVTPRDLLTHRTGLPRHELVWFGRPDVPRDEIVRSLALLEPTASLRQTWQYCNLTYVAAGYLAGQITDSTWEDQVRQRIFTPLGMKRVTLSTYAMVKDENFAYPYQVEEGKDPERIDFRRIQHVGPAGSINTSVNELAAWLKVHLNSGKLGEKQLLSPNLMRGLHTPQMLMKLIASDDMISIGYALGWMIDVYRGKFRVHHAGGIDGFTANIALIPEEKIAVAVLTNSNSPLPSLITNHALDRLLELEPRDWNAKSLAAYEQAIALAAQAKEVEQAAAEATPSSTEASPPPLPSHPLENYAGDFTHPAYGTIHVEVEEQTLHARFNTLDAPLKHLSYDVFAVTDDAFALLKSQRWIFQTDIQGKIQRVLVPVQAGVKPVVFQRQIDPALSAADALEPFTGEYLLETAGVTAIVTFQQDQLTVKIPSQPTYKLSPSDQDEFTFDDLPGFRVLFERDENGLISSLVFDQPNGKFKAIRQND